MIDPIRAKAKLLAATFFAFLFGLGLASGLQWTRGSVAAPSPSVMAGAQAVLPQSQEIREATELSDAFIAIADAVTPAVVQIQAERTGADPHSDLLPPGFRDFFGVPPEGDPQGYPQVAGGSGFLVSPDGYILTNNHVVAGADRITVTLVDKRTFPAEIIGRDPTTDVAVIDIDAEQLPAVRLGDSDEARVGEWVLAVGNPGFGGASGTLDFTVTGGIISAKGRGLEIINRELLADNPAAASYAIEDFIQTDAVINPGNSGGPLVNLRGEVIGVNTAIASGTGFYQGYGFAIPINLARRVMEDLIESGHVRRALLGIVIQNVTPEDAEVYGLPDISGVLVEDFGRDSPAEDAGVERHDVIVAVDGTPVARVGQLQRIIAGREPGAVVDVAVIRFGERETFSVRLGQAPIPEFEPRASVQPPEPEGDGLGIEVSDLDQALARQLGFDRASGAVVAQVRPMSPAFRKGVMRGHRILSIDRRPVESARDAEAAIRNARSGDVVSLLMQAPDGRTYIANIRMP